MNRRPTKDIFTYTLSSNLYDEDLELYEHLIEIKNYLEVVGSIRLIEDYEGSLELFETYIQWPDNWPLELALNTAYYLFPDKRFFTTINFVQNIGFFYSNEYLQNYKPQFDPIQKSPTENPDLELDNQDTSTSPVISNYVC